MELWLIYAFAAAIFAALTTIFAKIGLRNMDSHLATALRTVVVLAFAWAMVGITGTFTELAYIAPRTWVFLVLSGLTTGGAWLCFFRALKWGDVNKVTPLKKSSTLLTMAMAFIILGEPIGPTTIVGMLLMGSGIFLMLKQKKTSQNTKKGWFWYALAAAIFASLTAIFASLGLTGMDATLWTALRTMVVLPLAWLMVFTAGSHKKHGGINIKSLVFLVLSGMATGASWLFFYHALQTGQASHVVPIDKLSIVFTMFFARVCLREVFSSRAWFGLLLLVVGTLLPILF